MAQHKTKQEYIELSLKAIDDYKLIFITDVPRYLGISVTRFYQLELEKVEDIKQAVETNRIDIKVSLRKKWYESENPTLQILLFKLVATDEERKRTAQNYVDITTGGEKIKAVNPFTEMSKEDLLSFGEELENIIEDEKDNRTD